MITDHGGNNNRGHQYVDHAGHLTGKAEEGWGERFLHRPKNEHHRHHRLLRQRVHAEAGARRDQVVGEGERVPHRQGGGGLLRQDRGPARAGRPAVHEVAAVQEVQEPVCVRVQQGRPLRQ